MAEATTTVCTHSQQVFAKGDHVILARLHLLRPYPPFSTLLGRVPYSVQFKGMEPTPGNDTCMFAQPHSQHSTHICTAAGRNHTRHRQQQTTGLAQDAKGTLMAEATTTVCTHSQQVFAKGDVILARLHLLRPYPPFSTLLGRVPYSVQFMGMEPTPGNDTCMFAQPHSQHSTQTCKTEHQPHAPYPSPADCQPIQCRLLIMSHATRHAVQKAANFWYA
jgi:hypothetical protein